MKVPFLDLHAAYLELKPEIDAAISRVLDSGWYILGPEVDAFEAEYAAYCEAEHAIGVANGLDALHLALLAMGVGPGDEVIVPSNTYIATWLAVSQCGATPVPVEPVESTYNIDPARIEAAITPATRVILPVHLYGQPADLDPILAVARQHGLRVLEDAAQAHGARYKGRRIGSHGDAVAWSFYPGKNLGAIGDGGAVLGTFPTMLATVTDATGKAVSIHRTYIQGGRKAPVPAPKKLMQGLPLAGAAIRLTPVSGTLGIAEGIETALAASELFEVPTWSCISTSGIESFEPPEGVEHVVIFADHDANYAGQKAAYAAAHRLALKGIEVEVCIPPTAGDWLDELNRRRPPPA